LTLALAHRRRRHTTRPITTAAAIGGTPGFTDPVSSAFAALQLSAGTHFMQVSKWLGHAKNLITMSVYADWIQDEEAANTLPEPVAAPIAANTNVVPLRPAQNG
jgi:hypothetical protein